MYRLAFLYPRSVDAALFAPCSTLGGTVARGVGAESSSLSDDILQVRRQRLSNSGEEVGDMEVVVLLGVRSEVKVHPTDRSQRASTINVPHKYAP